MAKNINELEEIRLRLLTLVGSESITMIRNSYSLQTEDEDGNPFLDEKGNSIRRRVVSGKKTLVLKKVDWKKAKKMQQGNHARVRVRIILNEMATLIKNAKKILAELQEEYDNNMKKVYQEKYKNNRKYGDE
jgi:hypothetical protein